MDIGINGTRILITSQVYLLDARETNPEPINVVKVGGVRRGPSQGHILRSKFMTSSTDYFNLFTTKRRRYYSNSILAIAKGF